MYLDCKRVYALISNGSISSRRLQIAVTANSMTIILAVLNARVAKQKTIIVFMEEEIALVILTRPRLRATVTTDGSGGRLLPLKRQVGRRWINQSCRF